MGVVTYFVCWKGHLSLDGYFQDMSHFSVLVSNKKMQQIGVQANEGRTPWQSTVGPWAGARGGQAARGTGGLWGIINWGTLHMARGISSQGASLYKAVSFYLGRAPLEKVQ